MTSAAADLPALLVEAQSGEPRALAVLLARCQPDIRRYAQRACMVSVVDDAVQETLLVLARHVGAVRHAAGLSRWLFVVARRECRRLARRLLSLDLWDEARVEAWAGERPSDELRLEIAQALESLPEDARAVVVLRDFEGLTVGEIAARLGITRAATKSRLHRARQLTREYLLGEETAGSGPDTPA